VPLLEPADGVTPVIDSKSALMRTVAAMAFGTGPVAADAERASGYRYGQATYLVQLRREGAGTALIDPVALPDLSSITSAVGDAEWVLHSASQDLPGFFDHGLRPASLFDTELAARLLGLPRVGLGPIVGDLMGLGLAKAYSAADWSTRPLPTDWLRYAALDVEVLVELRNILAERLEVAGKTEWARQEFAHVLAVAGQPAPEKVDPWRKTSGTHQIRDRQSLAVVRALWQARDNSARSRDIAPGRVLPDRAIIAAALAKPRSVGMLVRIPEFSGKGQRRRSAQWQRAIDSALGLREDQWPTLRGPSSDGPPQPRLWKERNPEAFVRLEAARAVISEISERCVVPVENLLQPDALRRLAWAPPSSLDAETIAEFLRGRHAREWQIDQVAVPLAKALA
jgi:ribonuclease D